METSELFQTECEPTSSRRAHPVNRGLAPGSEWATRMTELSGLSLSRSLNGSSRITSCLKMLLGSSAWRSTACYLTWKRKATKQGRSYYQLAPSTPRTGEIGSGLWATPQNRDHFPAHRPEYIAEKKAQGHGMRNLNDEVMMFPTPRATQGRGKTGNRSPENAKRAGWTLSEVAGLWPTPRASANENRQSKPTPSQLAGKHGMNLATAVHLLPTPTANRWDGLQSHGVNVVEGSLNPDWVEILQGYPTGWTDLSAADPNTGTATGSAESTESQKACQTAPAG